LDKDIHVFQWCGTVGEVEYKYDYLADTKKMNERTTDFAPFQKS